MLARPQRTQLNRALSKLGLCSRGVAAAWIAAGRVRVNGEPAVSPEQWVELGVDRIEADEPGSGGVAESRPPVYLALHKPPGYVTTRSDELGRKTVYDLLPPEYAGGWVFPVGRLDKDSEGLLLLTNDGAWSDRLTDPERHVAKVYRVKLDGKPRADELERFRGGIELDGSLTAPAEVEADAEGAGWHRVVLTEGRNRQIRRMFHALAYKVKRLVRVSIGTLELGDLGAGETRVLPGEAVAALRKAAR